MSKIDTFKEVERDAILIFMFQEINIILFETNSVQNLYVHCSRVNEKCGLLLWQGMILKYCASVIIFVQRSALGPRSGLDGTDGIDLNGIGLGTSIWIGRNGRNQFEQDGIDLNESFEAHPKCRTP